MNLVDLVRNQLDRAAACVAAAVGLLALLLGYLGISATPYPQEQLPYLISGGAFGLFMLGVSGVLWITADLRDEWRKLDDLDDRLAALLTALPVEGPQDAAPAAPAVLQRGLPRRRDASPRSDQGRGPATGPERVRRTARGTTSPS